MPVYMDRHEPTGVTLEDVIQGHGRDLAVQDKYGVHYLTYWFDPANGAVFCFVDAPSAEAAAATHREAHGLIASKIIEVDLRTVTDFLGKIEEPAAAEAIQSGFRTILFTDIEGSTSLSDRLGDQKATQLVRMHDEIVNRGIEAGGGSRIKHTGDGIMASFVSTSRAVQSAIAIQREFEERKTGPGEVAIHVRIGISAGEPVEDHDDLFGAAVALCRRICDSCEPGRILVSSAVRELCLGKAFSFTDRGRRRLKGFQEPVRVYQVRWKEAAR